MTDVKIVKKGNGIPQMTYQSRVATFDQFRKSPDKYTKGTTASSSADVKSEGGDKDYKQLLIKEGLDGKSVDELIQDGIGNIEKSDLTPEEKQKSIEGLNQFKDMVDKLGEAEQQKVVSNILAVKTAQPVNENVAINESGLKDIAKFIAIAGGLGTVAFAISSVLGLYDAQVAILNTAEALGLTRDPNMLNIYAAGIGLLGTALASGGVAVALKDADTH